MPRCRDIGTNLIEVSSSGNLNASLGACGARGRFFHPNGSYTPTVTAVIISGLMAIGGIWFEGSKRYRLQTSHCLYCDFEILYVEF